MTELSTEVLESAVMISSVIPEEVYYGVKTNYEINFKLFGEDDSVDLEEIVLDLSVEYYPYTLSTYNPTVTLFRELT